MEINYLFILTLFRFKMLTMRRVKVPEFKNYRMIPAFEKEIPKGLIEAREKRVVANRKELFGSGDPVRGEKLAFILFLSLLVLVYLGLMLCLQEPAVYLWNS